MKYIYIIALLAAMVSCKKKVQENEKRTLVDISSIEAINKELDSSPTAGGFNKRAQFYIGENNLDAAFEDVKMAISLDSTKGESYFTAAQIFRKSLQIPLSLEYAKKAEQKGMNNEDLFLLMAEENLILMQYQQAISFANKVLKINQNNHLAYYYKGKVYEETKDFERSISSYQTALEQDSKFPDAYNSLIKIYTLNKQYEMASQYVESGLRFLPEDKFIWFNYGVLVESQNLLDSAIVIYKNAEKIDSTFDLVKYRLANVYQKLGNLDNAESYYSSLLAINPTFEVAYVEIGKLLLNNKKKEKAKELLRKGLIQFPDNKEIQNLYNQTK